MVKQRSDKPQEPPWCSGNRAEVWRGAKAQDCPATAECSDCSRSLKIVAVPDAETWAAYLPVHRIPTLP